MRFLTSILLCLALIGAPGCQSTSTERRALQVVQTTTKSADAILDAYAAAAVLGKLSAADEAKIVQLDVEYRKAKAIARAAIVAYKTAPQDDRNLKASVAALQAVINAILSLPKAP